jgi:drug/metabolite transporter (DMT)-like permease
MKINSYAVIGALCIIIAASLWGVDGVVLRPKLYSLDVPVVVFLEHFIAFLVMILFLAISFVFGYKILKKDFAELKKLGSKDWVLFFFIALLGGAIGTMAITKALFYVNFQGLSVIVILQKLQPLFAILLAIIMLKERPKPTFYIWAAIALIGSYLLTFGFNMPVFAGNKLFVASMLSLLAAFSWG